MEERKVPQPQRSNIDGIKVRKPSPDNPVVGNPAVPNTQKTPDQPPQEKQQPRQVAAKAPKKGKNLPVVILAVIILVGLSALAVYARLQQKSDDSGNNTAATSSADGVDSKQLIDQTINDIDQLNDKPDSSGEGLSDEQLGL